MCSFLRDRRLSKSPVATNAESNSALKRLPDTIVAEPVFYAIKAGQQVYDSDHRCRIISLATIWHRFRGHAAFPWFASAARTRAMFSYDPYSFLTDVFFGRFGLL
jgi:hypothetical protein